MASGAAGPAKTFDVEFKDAAPNATVEVWRVDNDHSNVLKAFDAMGRPSVDLSQNQITALRAAGSLSPAEHLRLSHGKLELTVPAHGLAVVTLER